MLNQVFDPENLFWRIVSRLVDFVGLSIFCAILCIPVVTAVPALCALYYTVVKVFLYKQTRTFRIFFQTFARDFLKNVVVGLICIPIIALCVFGYLVMFANSGTNLGAIAFVIYYICLIVPVGTVLYVIFINARFSLGKLELFKQALSMTFAHLPSTLVLVLLSLELCLWSVNNWTPALITPCLWALVSSFFVERNFEKHLSDEEKAAFRGVSLEDFYEQEANRKKARATLFRK